MIRSTFLIILAAVSAGLLAPPVGAQVFRSPSVSPRDKALEDKYRSDDIERIHRASATIPKERSVTRFPQIKEDFEGIQLINITTLQAPTLDLNRDQDRIAEATGEIKKRASRLKSNLFPSDSKVREKPSERHYPQGLKSLLADLDRVISNFVHNPMFENTRVVNSEDSAKAEQDLELIIELSTKAKKRHVRRSSPDSR